MAENKVMYGLKNVHYAKLTETVGEGGVVTTSYGSPKAWPGAVNISLDPSGDPIFFAADNSAYYTIANNRGYEGDYECARIPDDVRVDIVGNHVDDNGMVVETDKDELDYFALLFEIDGDQKPNKYVFYKVALAKRPSVSSQTTDPNNDLEVGTEAVTFKAVPRTDFIELDGKECHLIKAFTSKGTDATAYTNFYSQVYEPSFDGES